MENDYVPEILRKSDVYVTRLGNLTVYILAWHLFISILLSSNGSVYWSNVCTQDFIVAVILIIITNIIWILLLIYKYCIAVDDNERLYRYLIIMNAVACVFPFVHGIYKKPKHEGNCDDESLYLMNVIYTVIVSIYLVLRLGIESYYYHFSEMNTEYIDEGIYENDDTLTAVV